MGNFRSDLPIGTSDAEVFLSGNVPNLDEAMNSQQPDWFNRFGIKSLTYKGMLDRFDTSLTSQEQVFTNQLARQSEEFQRFLDSSGYSGWDTQYAAGIVLNSHNQGFTRCESDGTACMFYTPLGTTPLPYTTTGDWSSESALFVARSADDVLRQDLANPTKGDALVAAGNRTQKDKNSDIPSVRDKITTPVDGTTSNQAGIELAVNDAMSSGSLFWPAGTYVSTGNIPNFWSISHYGPGVIKRGDSIFFITPKNKHSNTVYASSSGSQSNDGLTENEPLDSLSSAFDALQTFGRILDGHWNIILSGEFSGALAVSFPEKITSRNTIKILGDEVGGHPNIPTTVLDASGESVAGIKIRRQSFLMRDILLKNTNASCISASRSFLRLENVHTENQNGFSMDISHATDFYISGGIHRLNATNTDRAVIRELFNVNHAVGYLYDESTGNPVSGDKPIFIGSGTGRAFTAREGCTGHARADFGTSEGGFLHGVEVGSNSRVHIDSDASFAKNQNAIWCAPGGDVQPDPGINFNDGNENQNGRNIVFRQYSTSGILFPKGVSSTLVERNVTPGTVANTPGDTQLGTFNFMRGILKGAPTSNYAGKSLTIRLAGNIIGTAGIKRLIIRISDTQSGVSGDDIISVTLPSAATGQFVFECRFLARTGSTQRQETKVFINGQYPIITSSNLSLDMSSAYEFIKAIGQINEPGDQVVLSSSLEVSLEG